MKTIVNNVNNTFIVKNSKFITELISISNEEEVKANLKALVKKYPKATHYCYAYILKDQKKASDDQEPSNTAGLPMLNVLEKADLINVLAVTIRYFGGIKLGPGGLIRAYQRSVKEALEKAHLKEALPSYLLTITIPYSKQKQLDYLLKDIPYTKKYDLLITYTINLPQEKLSLIAAYDYKIEKESFIMK